NFFIFNLVNCLSCVWASIEEFELTKLDESLASILRISSISEFGSSSESISMIFSTKKLTILVENIN
ncbi:hypothetical protein BpHYR1_039639, partial [Brachionus plicatilis]